jgi:uncharacterized protein YdhG (YjbR/CyaY superfamily)
MTRATAKVTAPKKADGAGAVTAYIASQPAASQPALKLVREAIRKALPKAEETISYGIPAFRVDGRVVVYFAGWKAHYSLYPVTGAVAEALAAELEPYARSKGTVRFPLDERVPVRLIARIAKLLAAASAERAKARTKARSRT